MAADAENGDKTTSELPAPCYWQKINTGHKELLMAVNNESDLILQARDGAQDALRELIRRHKAQALRLACALCRNHHDAEDIVQVAFIKAFKNLGRFQQTATFSTWLYRIVVNVTRDHQRTNARRCDRLFSGSDNDHISHEYPAPEKTHPDKPVLNREIGAAIDAAILKLPERQREVFILKHIEAYKIRQISTLLHISQGAVKSNLWQATEKLKNYLSPFNDHREVSHEKMCSN